MIEKEFVSFRMGRVLEMARKEVVLREKKKIMQTKIESDTKLQKF